MAILNNSNAISSGGYDINNSLRFRASASAYLNRTPASTTNQKTFTWSGWVKRGALSSDYRTLYMGGNTQTDTTFSINFSPSNEIEIRGYNTLWVLTTQVFRDPSAWYHIVVAVDTTQATAANRIILYVNGVQVTARTYTAPTQNTNFLVNTNVAQAIGYQTATWGFSYFDGYMAEVNWIDGQALTPSSFGETDTTTGVWKPKAYTSTYGTNGFYLKFSDIATTSGSNAGLGKDFSGNTNYWTTNNISVTAGTTYDAMIDVPTNTSATVANYCVLSPLAGDVAPTNGNLSVSGVDKSTLGTVGVTSGKWYFEMTCVSNVATTNNDGVGIGNCGVNNAAPDKAFYIYRSSGVKLQNGGSNTSYGASFTTGDVIGVAYDADAGTLVFYKNNSSQGTAFTGITGTMLPIVYARGITSTPTLALNFGQQPFIYTPPTGFVRLNTYNLPDSTIKKGNTVMDATTYSGTSATQNIVNAGGFKPDLVWMKSRSGALAHYLNDSVRGAYKTLFSSLTNAEYDGTSFNDGVSAFNSNGFTLLNGSNVGNYNQSGSTYVGWQWQAGQGSTSSNTSGTITSTVSVNTTAGFSVVTYTGTGANATVGHGLGVAPKWIIVKQRNGANNWVVKHASLSTNDSSLLLDATSAQTTYSPSVWNNTAPTSTVFSIGTNTASNSNTATYVAYCWAEIAGFSKFGSYTGNGSADGPFVYLGFRPKYILAKSTGTASWFVLDTARLGYNSANNYLLPNASSAEATYNGVDILSNGFKVRNTDSGYNDSGVTYIYAAYAENPFKNALAR
jgi:hypothetical protein